MAWEMVTGFKPALPQFMGITLWTRALPQHISGLDSAYGEICLFFEH